MKMAKRVLLLMVLIVIAIILFPTGSENPWVRARLNDSLQRFSSGKYTLLYDNVSVHGIYPNKRVVIERPRVIAKTATGAQVSYSSDTIEMKMLNASLTHWRLALPLEIGVTRNMAKAATIGFSDPPSADIIFAAPGSRNAEITLDLPARIGVGEINNPEKPAFITFSEKPTVGIKTDDEGKPVYARAVIKNMIAQGPAQPDRYALENGNFIYQNSVQPDGKHMQDVELVLDKFSMPDYIHPYGTGTLIFRASLFGDFDLTQDMLPQTLTREGDLEIMEASYNAADFGVNLKGDIKTQVAGMPIGQGNLMVRNVPFVLDEMIKNNMFTTDRRALLYTLLSKITGDSVSNLKDANIAIERKEDADVTVGGIPVSRIQEAFDRNDASLFGAKPMSAQSSSPASMNSIPKE